MYNRNKAKEAFLTLVGYRETAQAGSDCYGTLTPSLKTSDSCLWINDLPMVTMELINEIYDEDYESVNDYLDDVREYAIFHALDKFVNHQKNSINTKELIHNLALGSRSNKRSDLITSRNRFVGYEITPKTSNSVSSELVQLGLNFNTSVTDLPIYFYSSSQIDPIDTFTVTTTGAGLQWVTLANSTSGSGSTSDNSCQVSIPEVLTEYISDSYGTGDRYFIGYYESDLNDQGAKAIRGTTGCGCTGTQSKYSKWVTAQPVEVSVSDTFVSRESPDAEDFGVTSETYGLSVKINVKCDITSIMIQNKMMFANLVRYATASRILWGAYASNRLNAIKNVTKEDARLMAEKYEIDFENELKVLSIDFSGLDAQCIGKADNVFGIWGA